MGLGQHLQLVTPVPTAATGFLGADDVTAGGLQRRPLQAPVLVDGRNAAVTVERYDQGPTLSRWSLDPFRYF
jgi:hypothetical protein